MAGLCSIPADTLGVKGKSGVWKSVATRKAFGCEASHRVRFVCVPKPTSRSNPIEIWFGILSRRVIRRGGFRSTADLRNRILKSVDDYNGAMAKPLKRTSAGRPRNV